jgi:hypothetical protein
MDRVIEKVEVASRRSIEHLRDKLKMNGGHRLDRAWAECDTLRLALAWMTGLAVTVLLTFFVECAFSSDGLDCSILIIAGVILAIVNRAVDRRLVRHDNKRFYQALSEERRWCSRPTP